MGEAIKFPQNFKPSHPQQIQIDMKNAIPKLCACGGDIFLPATKLFSVSALVSPTGQELTVRQEVLVCKSCGEVVK